MIKLSFNGPVILMMTFIAQGKIFSHHFTAHQEKYFVFQHSDTFKEKKWHYGFDIYCLLEYCSKF